MVTGSLGIERRPCGCAVEYLSSPYERGCVARAVVLVRCARHPDPARAAAPAAPVARGGGVR